VIVVERVDLQFPTRGIKISWSFVDRVWRGGWRHARDRLKGARPLPVDPQAERMTAIEGTLQ
jgi:hypothetical protein